MEETPKGDESKIFDRTGIRGYLEKIHAAENRLPGGTAVKKETTMQPSHFTVKMREGDGMDSAVKSFPKELRDQVTLERGAGQTLEGPGVLSESAGAAIVARARKVFRGWGSGALHLRLRPGDRSLRIQEDLGGGTLEDELLTVAGGTGGRELYRVDGCYVPEDSEVLQGDGLRPHAARMLNKEPGALDPKLVEALYHKGQGRCKLKEVELSPDEQREPSTLAPGDVVLVVMEREEGTGKYGEAVPLRIVGMPRGGLKPRFFPNANDVATAVRAVTGGDYPGMFKQRYAIFLKGRLFTEPELVVEETSEEGWHAFGSTGGRGSMPGKTKLPEGITYRFLKLVDNQLGR